MLSSIFTWRPHKDSRDRPKALAVSSGGGHWVQLRRVAPAFKEFELIFVTVNPAYRGEAAPHRFYAINDATRWNKFKLMAMVVRIFLILWRERPDVVISTGAAPGFFALRLGHLMGARTIWIDSIANVEAMSMSGQKIGPHADLWLTQWPHLASPDGPKFVGQVL